METDFITKKLVFRTPSLNVRGIKKSDTKKFRLIMPLICSTLYNNVSLDFSYLNIFLRNSVLIFTKYFVVTYVKYFLYYPELGRNHT